VALQPLLISLSLRHSSLLPALRLPQQGRKSENISKNKLPVKESDGKNLAF